jgi:hypothetical protein
MANSATCLPTPIAIHTVTSHASQLLCMIGPFEIFVGLETAPVTDVCYCYSDQAKLWKESPPE